MHLLPLVIQRAVAEPSAPLCSVGTNRAHCGHCALHTAGMSCNDVVRRRVRKHQALYHHGDPYGAVYAVCSGTFKSAVSTAEGSERVIGFPVPGELLGLDGSANGSYATTATALEDADVCSIAPARFSAISALAGLAHEMLRMQQLLVLTGSASAEARVAQFLLDHALQLSQRGYSPHNFELKMSRADIGSYLGVKLETVSRSFSILQRMHLLQVDKRKVRIADPDGLTRLARSIHNRKLLVTFLTAEQAQAGTYRINTRPTVAPPLSPSRQSSLA